MRIINNIIWNIIEYQQDHDLPMWLNRILWWIREKFV